MSSQTFEFLVKLQQGSRAWEVGTIQQTPVPALKTDTLNLEKDSNLLHLVFDCVDKKRTLDAAIETSHVFRTK